MGGGGVMRAAAAAKVVGITAANGGFRGYALDHPVCAAVRPVAASAISSACDDVRGVRSAPDIPAAAEGMSVPKPILEFDDWGFSDEEESPPARLVFGSAPTLQEAKEATSDLKQAIDNLFLLPNHFGSSQATGGGLSSSFHILETQSCNNSSVTVSTPPTPGNALQAFRLLSESAAAQSVVASIASDPKVFAAVLENPELMQFIEAHKSSASSTGSNDLDVEDCASDNGSSYLPPPRSTDRPAFRTRFADFFNKYLPLPKNSDDKSESRSKVAGFYSKTKAAVTDMMSSLADYFHSIFGGDEVYVNEDGSAKIGAVEKTLGTSFLGLAIMVIMVFVLKQV
nr:Homeobox-leucine zipper protein [Ipomoea batatas]